MTPISLYAKGPDSYGVRFIVESSSDEIEYDFWIEMSGDIPVLCSDDEFLRLNLGDPGALELQKCLMAFYQSRKK